MKMGPFKRPRPSWNWGSGQAEPSTAVFASVEDPNILQLCKYKSINPLFLGSRELIAEFF